MRATVPCPLCFNKGRENPILVELTKVPRQTNAWEFGPAQCDLCGPLSGGVLYLSSPPLIRPGSYGQTDSARTV